MFLLNSTSVDAGAIFLYLHISVGPYDGASVLACASHPKVRSKNPKNFEYWFCGQLMSKIQNIFIKQHQRGRWRYLSLLAQSVGARFLACA